jgi:hypothetical protein
MIQTLKTVALTAVITAAIMAGMFVLAAWRVGVL